jgi:hypothetical protein
MKNLLPALTTLRLRLEDENMRRDLGLPDSFLGESAPRLRDIEFSGLIVFPALAKLLLSTRNLVRLALYDIPYSGYISPEAMLTILSKLPKLQSICLEFRSPRWHTYQESEHPPRIIFPALLDFYFKCDIHYLEYVVSRIDTPVLDHAEIMIFDEVFDTPLLRHFINHTETFNAPHRATVAFSGDHVMVKLFRRKGTTDYTALALGITCRHSWIGLRYVTQLCTSALPLLLSAVECLAFHEDIYPPRVFHYFEMHTDNARWLEILRKFPSVKELDLSGRLVPLFAPALQELTGQRVTHVLPALQSLSLQGPQAPGPTLEAIEQFIAARRLSGLPVTVHCQENREE